MKKPKPYPGLKEANKRANEVVNRIMGIKTSAAAMAKATRGRKTSFEDRKKKENKRACRKKIARNEQEE